MATLNIPNNRGEIRQSNRSDLFGELSASFNVNLSQIPGKIKSSAKLERILSSNDIGNDDPQALLLHDGKYYFATNDNVYVCASTDDVTDSSNWSTITVTSGTFNANSVDYSTDLISFGGDVLISSGTDIGAYTSSSGAFDGTWWSSTISGTSLTANFSHPMHVHRGGEETLIVADQNHIRYYNATSGHSTIDLDDLFVCTGFTSGVDAVWAATYTETSEYAYVYEFYIGETINSNPVARNAYKVDGRAVLAITALDNVPYVITDKGLLQAFIGSGFVTVAHLPFSYDPLNILDGSQPGLVSQNGIDRPVHPKGMATDKDSIYFLLKSGKEEGTQGDPVDTNTHAGLWEFNKATGNLAHRASPSDDANDCGQFKIKQSGPMIVGNDKNASILAACVLEGTNKHGLFGMKNTSGCGYVVTSEFQSGNVLDTYNTIYVKADTLAANDTILVKYKVKNDNTYPIYADITWSEANRFSSTDDLSNVQVGDEITVTEQASAGKCAHVTSITSSSSTYEVILDRSIGVAGEASRVRFENWKLVNATYTDSDGEYKRFGLPVVNTWIKAKVYWEGDVTIRGITIDSEPKHRV